MSDEMVVLQCESCSTRLKVRAVTARIMKDVKCPKCGKKVSTKSVAPTGETIPAPLAATPAPVVSAPAPAAPSPVPSAEAKPVEPAPTAPEAAPAPVVEPVAAPVPEPAPESAPAPAPAVVTPPAEPAESAELKLCRARITDLEQQITTLTNQAAELNAQLAKSATADTELAMMRRQVSDQETRLAQIQQLWYAKEKEARAANAEVLRMQKERKHAIDQLEAVLKAYHEAEIVAATDRINNLNERLQKYLADQMAARLGNP